MPHFAHIEPLAHTKAVRALIAGARVRIATAAGYFFYGYWFRQGRA